MSQPDIVSFLGFSPHALPGIDPFHREPVLQAEGPFQRRIRVSPFEDYPALRCKDPFQLGERVEELFSQRGPGRPCSELLADVSGGSGVTRFFLNRVFFEIPAPVIVAGDRASVHEEGRIEQNDVKDRVREREILEGSLNVRMVSVESGPSKVRVRVATIDSEASPELGLHPLLAHRDVELAEVELLPVVAELDARELVEAQGFFFLWRRFVISRALIFALSTHPASKNR